jgi:hypothetical protein
MATTNLITRSHGDIVFQHGNGTPDHASPLGSEYVDLDTGLHYTNIGGVSWSSISGNMLAATYDPTGVAADCFDYANSIGVTQVTGPIITPPTLTATADDYNPTGFATSNRIRQDIDVNNREISGFLAPAVGVAREFSISNINTGFDLKFLDNNSGSLAANRILLRDGADKSIKPNELAIFWYDHTSLRWRPSNRIG